MVKKHTFYIALFWLTNVAIWSIVFARLCLVRIGGDYYDHNAFAELVIKGKMKIAYPLYHWVVGLLAVILRVPAKIAAIPILVISQLFTIYLVSKLIKFLFEDSFDELKALLLSLAVNIICPPFWSRMAPAYSCSNTYGSPTQMIVKPFVVAGILLLLHTLKETNDHIAPNFKTQILLLLVMLGGCLAKPAYLMAFVPAAGVFYIYRIAKSSHSFTDFIVGYIRNIWPYFVCGIALIIQYIYGSNIVNEGAVFAGIDANGGIRFGPWVSWKYAIDWPLLSIVLAYMLPLVTVILFKIKTDGIRRDYLLFTVIYGVISFIFMALLYQENHIQDVNFRNIWIYTFLFVHAFFVPEIFVQRDKVWYKQIPVLGLLSLEILFGIVLIVRKAVLG